MTRKINVYKLLFYICVFRNFYHYLKENSKKLNLDSEILNSFKINMRHTSKSKFQELYMNNPKFIEIYQTYLNSYNFKRLVNAMKHKYDDLYMKLFLRHSINFLNFYYKDNEMNGEGKVETSNQISDQINGKLSSYDFEKIENF
jgi:hypothetical protein